MDITALLSKLMDVIFSGGGDKGITAILLIIVGALWYERRNLIKNLQQKDEKVSEILENYYKGNLTLSEALSGLRSLLAEIKSKL